MNKRVTIILLLFFMLFNIHTQDKRKPDSDKGKSHSGNEIIQKEQNDKLKNRVDNKREQNGEGKTGHHSDMRNREDIHNRIKFSDETERQVELLSKKTKKEKITTNDIELLKESCRKIFDKSSQLFNDIDHELIKDQIINIEQSEYEINKKVNEIEEKIKPDKYNNKSIQKLLIEVKKNMNRLNRQYRAINWILFEEE